MNIKTYEGLLSIDSYGEADDILYLSSVDDPLAEELEWMSGKNVTVRYWICDEKCTKEEAKEGFIKKLLGVAKVDFGQQYSEYTGYLWTDEELRVGGHNLLEELRSNIGKWLILEVETI